MQGLGVGDRFGRRTHFRLGDDFQQGSAGTVEVDARLAVKILVQRFSCVFFQVGASQTDGFLIGLLAFANLNHDAAADYYRQLELADLVTLRQIRVEVVLAGKDRFCGDLATNGETELDRAFDRAAVQYRQHARQGQVDGASLRVGRGTERRRGARKNLGLGR